MCIFLVIYVYFINKNEFLAQVNKSYFTKTKEFNMCFIKVLMIFLN